MITVSIVVPVYNVREYLPRCLSSIQGQTYQSLDIILVDDGSTDGSEVICDELAEQDNRVQVIHKPNGGLGSARNAGIAQAKGLYIGFVDSDDWIEPEMIQNMMEQMMRTDAQITACNICRVDESGRKTYYNDHYEERLTYTTEQALTELPKNERLSNSMCNKLFHRDILSGLRINESMHYEDNPFTPQCIARAERIAYTGEPYYNYYERSGSISRSNFSLKEFDRVLADRMRLDYYHNNFPECEDSAAIAYIGSGLKVYYNSRKTKEATQKRASLKKELRRAIKRYYDLPYTKKQKAKARLFYLSPAIYTMVMTIRSPYSN